MRHPHNVIIAFLSQLSYIIVESKFSVPVKNFPLANECVSKIQMANGGGVNSSMIY
jgi:hypothetical protein